MLKNITFSVDDKDIAAAREAAEASNTTLNEAARQWLREYGERHRRKAAVDSFFQELGEMKVDRKYTREEMNERR
jgi:hypothetical protein